MTGIYAYFGVMLAFVRHMDQIVKALTLSVSLATSVLELIFVKPDQLPDRVSANASRSSFASLQYTTLVTEHSTAYLLRLGGLQFDCHKF